MTQAQKYAGPAGPEPATQYLIFQTLIGAFPIDEERLGAYLSKAIREAKLHTSWTAPDEAYEAAVASYLSGVLADRTIMTAAGEYAGELEEPGRVNALSMKLLQLTMPGIPDTYQGSELWDLSLVDPDNRRPVDFGERARIVATLDRADAALPRVDDTGAAKLHLYAPPCACGASGRAFRSGVGVRTAAGQRFAAEHVVAFSRGPVGGPERMVTVVPRLVLGCAGAAAGKTPASNCPPDSGRT